jgi:hypothetical protein
LLFFYVFAFFGVRRERGEEREERDARENLRDVTLNSYFFGGGGRIFEKKKKKKSRARTTPYKIQRARVRDEHRIIDIKRAANARVREKKST